MIITQTPLRISFAGGGTDFAGFYKEDEGCVISSAIDKYIYIIVKERFDRKIRVGYSRTEMVDSVDEIEHELVREALRMTGIDHGIEIATMADIPSEGSGLGSSSTVTVGLLNALYTYKGEIVPAERLASEACKIEIDILGKPIGKQDQYIAAYGGLRFIRFKMDDTVDVERVEISPERRRELNDSLLLFFTGVTRKAGGILQEQKANIEDKRETLRRMKAQATEIHQAILNGAPMIRIGRVLHQGWEFKRQLAGSISNPEIDQMYEAALDAGATGGKIAGAGGGGFLLLFCPPDRQARVRQALSHLRELSFNLERDGTKVILNARR